ncbi:MAG: S41 family peptidase [Holosporales bacterium]
MTECQGYYSYPAVRDDVVVFVSEEDLWQVPLAGGVARRLTHGLGASSTPVFSPCGQMLAFSGGHEGGQEVYIMPAHGGDAKRLTYLGSNCTVVAWTNEGIFFVSSAQQPFARLNALWCVKPETGHATPMKLGPVNYAAFADQGGKGMVLQRHGYREYGFWKRYRGGTAGEVWIDTQGDRTFKKLVTLHSDMARPLWVGERIYFASDHEGVGNLYSCTLGGEDVTRHTQHEDYYVRNQSTDGKTIVYHAGGDLYALDLHTHTTRPIAITFHSLRTQKRRKFVAASDYLESYDLHPQGHHLAVVTRGKAYTFGNWEGPVLPHAMEDDVRYRLSCWLNDGKRMVAAYDAPLNDHLALFDVQELSLIERSPVLNIGRITDILSSPHEDAVIVTNHRNEIIHVDLSTWQIQVIDRSHQAMFSGVTWSPDGRWVAYSKSLSRHRMAIFLWEKASGKTHQITDPVLKDVEPSFDPEGKYLYFISYRQFDPAWDSLHFEMGFPRGMRPYVVLLQSDLPNPFLLKEADLAKSEEDDEDNDKSKVKKNKKKEEKSSPEPIKIDLDGIQQRVIAFPVQDGIYSQVAGLKGKVLFLNWPNEGTLPDGEESEEDHSAGLVEVFDFETLKVETFADHVHSFSLSQDSQWVAYASDHRLRVVKADERHEDRHEGERPSKKTGWIDLSRLRVSVDPGFEWRQIYREAWQLQRDHFWTEDMSSVDWQRVYERYARLLPRLSARSELSDLLWEMQGELGTSHAYVFGGDLRRQPSWGVGQLGARFAFNAKHKAYEVVEILPGDTWNRTASSPLAQPGVGVNVGDLIWAVNGVPVREDVPLESHFVNMVGAELRLKVSDGKGRNVRHVALKTLASDRLASYRTWVENNRAYVHHHSKGRVGYVHIPDMGPAGFAEFHRYFLVECERDGLIVDARYNGGGSVSPLILEKLSRRRLGFDHTRWFGDIPYPEDSPAGPMVCLTNQYAGSDGDMFSHAFKALKLGKLIGKRTWGGVIGIWPRHHLIDGGTTTQPEFSFWFKDAGWSIENYGVEPDIDIDLSPQDFVAGRDPQMDRALKEVLQEIEANPPLKMTGLSAKPKLPLP